MSAPNPTFCCDSPCGSAAQIGALFITGSHCYGLSPIDAEPCTLNCGAEILPQCSLLAFFVDQLMVKSCGQEAHKFGEGLHGVTVSRLAVCNLHGYVQLNVAHNHCNTSLLYGYIWTSIAAVLAEIICSDSVFLVAHGTCKS